MGRLWTYFSSAGTLPLCSSGACVLGTDSWRIIAEPSHRTQEIRWAEVNKALISLFVVFLKKSGEISLFPSLSPSRSLCIGCDRKLCVNRASQQFHWSGHPFFHALLLLCQCCCSSSSWSVSAWSMHPERPLPQAMPSSLGQNLRDMAMGLGRGKNLLGGNIAYGFIRSMKECLYFLLCCWCIKEILDWVTTEDRRWYCSTIYSLTFWFCYSVASLSIPFSTLDCLFYFLSDRKDRVSKTECNGECMTSWFNTKLNTIDQHYHIVLRLWLWYIADLVFFRCCSKSSAGQLVACS